MSTTQQTTGALVGRERIDVTAFCKRERITMEATRTNSNPNMESDHPMDHWKCYLSRVDSNGYDGHHLAITFSMGLGHKGKAPKVDEVMNCLASDYTEENASLEDWCAEYGYDTDSRKAERTFQACVEQSEELLRFLDAELVRELVYDVERP